MDPNAPKFFCKLCLKIQRLIDAFTEESKQGEEMEKKEEMVPKKRSKKEEDKGKKPKKKQKKQQEKELELQMADVDWEEEL